MNSVSQVPAKQIPYHELPATPGEMQLVNGIEGKTSEGSCVKIWQIESPEGGFVIEMTKPLENEKESKLEFALTTEAACVLLACLGTYFENPESPEPAHRTGKKSLTWQQWCQRPRPASRLKITGEYVKTLSCHGMAITLEWSRSGLRQGYVVDSAKPNDPVNRRALARVLQELRAWERRMKAAQPAPDPTLCTP